MPYGLTISRSHRSFKSRSYAEATSPLSIRIRQVVADFVVYYFLNAREPCLLPKAILLLSLREVDRVGIERVVALR